MKTVFHYGVDQLTTKIALQIAARQKKSDINQQAKNRIKSSHQVIQQIIEKKQKIYGVNTGFGSLCDIQIPAQQLIKLQENLFKSHSVGTGRTLSNELVRLMMITKLHALALGYSGVSLGLVKQIQNFIDTGLIPFVPNQGSLGASGDLAPLAHLFSPLSGQGKLYYQGKFQGTGQVLRAFQIKPIQLQAKEGLALINGTQFVSAHSIKISQHLSRLLDYADLIAAMSIEALHGSLSPYAQRMHQLRPHPGAIKVAKNIRLFLKNSINLEQPYPTKLQDPYSIRCIPQVHGSSRDALRHLDKILKRELNAVTDNPIIFPDGQALSGGNFHAQPLALALDYVALAAHELGNITDRRCYLLLQGKNGLPPYLIANPGLNTGFMIMQYTSAALVSENKSLCFPASADSIPTSKGQEDHVSMAPISARKALEIIANLQAILAIELICAAQALDFRTGNYGKKHFRKNQSSPVVEAFHQKIRQHIPFLKKDSEEMSEFIPIAKKILDTRKIFTLVTKKI